MRKKPHTVDSDTEEWGLAYRRRSLGSSVFWTTLIVFALLYGGLLGIGRTAGFREFLANALSTSLGMAVGIGGCHITLGLELVASDVEVKAAAPATHTVLTAKKVRMDLAMGRAWRWASGSIRSANLEDVGIVLRPGPEGRWDPELLHAGVARILESQGLPIPVARHRPSLAELSEEEFAVAEPVAGARAIPKSGGNARKPDVMVRNGHIIYQDGDGSLVGSLIGLQFDRRELAVPGRPLHYGRLACAEMRFQAFQVAGLDCSWIETEEGFVLLDAQVGRDDPKAGGVRGPEDAPWSAPVAQPSAPPEGLVLSGDIAAEEDPAALRERIRQSLFDAFK